MKEIKILIRNLREYPDNFFAYPTTTKIGSLESGLSNPKKVIVGLTVCNHLGELQGFIETGSKEGVVIK